MCVCAPPRTPAEGVLIYGNPQWPDVRALHTFFEDRGVVWDQYDAAHDQMHAVSGQTTQAVTVIGKAVFVGYVPDQIEQRLP